MDTLHGIIYIFFFFQFFYRDYKRKVTDRLNTFDKDYGAALEEEHKRLKKVFTEYHYNSNK